MNNFVIGLKRFFTNKNVVTVIGVIVVLGVLYFGYSSTIKKATKPVTIPVAAKSISPQTKITKEDIVYKQVASSMVSDGVILTSTELIGKYTNINVSVPEGSVFYNEWIVDAKDLPGNWIEQLNYKKGELGYYMDVNIESTLGNSVLPDTYVDVYMKAKDENGTIMFGKLMENIKVLVVHDNNGKNVFANTKETGSPSKLGFAVNQDLYILLKKAEYLELDLVIAPRGSTVPTKNYIIVTSATLRDYIDAQTITVPEDVILEETKDTDKKDDTESIDKEETEQTTNDSMSNNGIGTETIQ